ncbi:MAG: dihydrolipoyl dehydrogenase [Nitrospirae bacterium]|nr:dihydrolipoyl dehydrogenase [Nitrospirota bacterium]MCL5421156.1 dihydrolipoyl dehydrogenase [Nitrospirota bacterium]
MRVAVIGGGPGGYVAALKAAQLGAQVTVIEKSEVGGTCLNRGCIPTKTLIASAEILHKLKSLADYGLELNGSVSPNLSKMMERKDKVVAIQVKGIKGLFKSWGVNLSQGKGTLLSAGRIEVEKEDGTRDTVEADSIIIATGSRPARIPTFPFDGEKILSSDEAVTIKEIPKSLLIVGAGVIGSEFACLFSEFGTEVTMVEVQDRALSTEDGEVSELLEREFKKKGVKLFTGASVTRVEAREDGMHSFLSDGKELVTEKILVSVGRSFNTENMGLESLGIQKGKKGEIIVNEKMETNVEGVYAIGDVAGGMLLAHKASREGIVAASNACGKEARMDYSVVPAAIFTSPEIASVGLREHQAVEKGSSFRKGSFLYRALGKAHAMGEITGFFKIIADAGSDRIIGAHIVGPHASDLIHEVAVAMRTGLKVRDIAETIHAHPTLSEGLLEACEDVHGEAIHVQKK